MMIQTENLPSKIAQLEYQKGLFSEALLWANKVARDSLSKYNHSEWLDALRLILLCSFELQNLKSFESHLPQLKKLEQEFEGPDKAAVQYLLSHYLVIQKDEYAEASIAETIKTSAQTQNFVCLARTLALATHFYCSEPNRNLSRALEYLNKLDIMIKELDIQDLNVTALVLRSYALGNSAQYERAFDLIWKAYEQAQQSGYQIIMPTILAQIARLYQQQNKQDFFKMYADLALKGVHPKNHPRLYNQISEFCKFYCVRPSSAYDFILEADLLTLREKEKGYIDFKNQHILFDLTLLFFKNPGTRFSKEELIELIWKQVYDPENHDNLIYVSIKRLRFLLEANSESPRYILRDRKGYYLNSQTQIKFNNHEETKT